MIRVPLFLLLFISAVVAAGCGVKQNPDEPTDDCSGDGTTKNDHTKLYAGTSWSTSTPLAAGDCTAGYTFFVRWAKKARSDTSRYAPPVEWSFNPTAVAGFVLSFSQTAGPTAYPGTGWFTESFSPDVPTTASGNTTAYKIFAQMPGSNPDDSVEIYTMTHYYLSKK